MKRWRKILALLLAAALCAGLCATPASTATIPGLSVTKASSYHRDGSFYMNFNLNASDNYNTRFAVTLVNSSGSTIFTWQDVVVNRGTRTTHAFGANYNSLPTGTYTMKIRGEVRVSPGDLGYHYYSEYAYYNFTINHTKSATVDYQKCTKVAQNDGTYRAYFYLDYVNCKGKTIYLEVYNAAGKRYASLSSTATYDTGTKHFWWDGYPDEGGLRGADGTYTIKYWVSGGNPKQRTVNVSF